MESLIFLSQRIPFPPNKGDKLRSFAIFKHLAKTYNIYLGCFIDDPNDWQYVDELRRYCSDVCCIGLNPGWAKLRSLPGFLSGKSLSEGYFHSPALARWVNQTLAEHQPASAFLFSSVMGQYLPLGIANRPRRLVMDFVDVDSDKWRQYAAMRTGIMRWVYERESRTLLTFDRRIAAQMDASVLVSEPEAALFRSLAPESAERIFAITNGIDHNYFSPQPSSASGEAAAVQPYADPFPAGRKAIVLTGAMDYWPNIDAAQWFANAMLPAIRAQIPEALFAVVGGNPSAELQKLDDGETILVTGRVADVRPYLAHAQAVVAPLRVARGIQNKVLEGMAMGRAVITTSQGYEGIDAVAGHDLLVADSESDFIAATLAALTQVERGSIGAQARQRIIEGYDWNDKLARFDALLSGS